MQYTSSASYITNYEGACCSKKKKTMNFKFSSTDIIALMRSTCGPGGQKNMFMSFIKSTI